MQSVDIYELNIVKDLQTAVAIFKFSNVRILFSLMWRKIIKHGDPVDDRRIMGL